MFDRVLNTLLDAEIYFFHLFSIFQNHAKLLLLHQACNTIEDPFGRICVANKIEGVHLIVFNMIKGINESKILAKHISREC